MMIFKQKINITSGVYTDVFTPGSGFISTMITLSGYNNSPSSKYIIIVDSLVAPAPASGPGPNGISFIVASNTNFSFTPPIVPNNQGRVFNQGIWVVSSSTGNIYTPTGTPDFWFQMEYALN